MKPFPYYWSSFEHFHHLIWRTESKYFGGGRKIYYCRIFSVLGSFSPFWAKGAKKKILPRSSSWSDKKATIWGCLKHKIMVFVALKGGKTIYQKRNYSASADCIIRFLSNLIKFAWKKYVKNAVLKRATITRKVLLFCVWEQSLQNSLFIICGGKHCKMNSNVLFFSCMWKIQPQFSKLEYCII